MASLTAQRKTTGRAGTLALALGCGLLAAALAYLLVGRQAVTAGGLSARPVPVVVAARDIPARALVTNAMLRIDRLPPSQAPADSVRATGALVGKVAAGPIAAGQAVTRGMVTERSARMGLAYALPRSFRAVTVPLDPVSGAAGLLRPGDHVDLLATFETGDGQAVTRTVLQDAALLALGSQTAAPAAAASSDRDRSAPPPPASSATVMVSPRDAQTLVLAAARGKVQLALRAPDDAARPDIPALHSSAVAGAAPRRTAVEAALPRTGPRKTTPAPSAHREPPPTPLPTLPVRAAPLFPTITVVKGSEVKTITVSR